MKRKDLHVGMVVALGSHNDMRNGCARRAVIVDLGFWRAKSGGYNQPDMLEHREKFRADYARIAVARQFGSDAELSDNKEPAADTDWRAGLALAKDVLGSWEDTLAKYHKSEEGREVSRAFRAKLDDEKWELLASLAAHGIQLSRGRYDGASMDQEQTAALVKKLTDLGSKPSEVVVHARKKFPNRAFCDDEPGGFDTGDPARLGVDIYPDHVLKRVTCQKCLDAMVKMNARDITDAM